MVHPATLPSALPPRGDLPVTAAAQTLSPARATNFLPPLPQGRQLLAGLPTLVPWLLWLGESFLCPLSNLLSPALSGSRTSSPTKPGPRRRPPQRTRTCGWSIGALARHPRPGELSEKGRREPGEERGLESVLLRARKPPGLILLAQLPLAECILLSQWDWAGRRGKRCGLCGLMDQPLPYLCPE